MTREQKIQVCTEATERFKRLNYSGETPTVTREQEIAYLLHDLGCHGRKVGKLLGLLIPGTPTEPIERPDTRYVKYTVPFAVFVPLSAPNRHTYTLNKPVMSTGGGQTAMIAPFGGSGKMTRTLDAVRPATAEEIAEFADAWTE